MSGLIRYSNKINVLDAMNGTHDNIEIMLLFNQHALSMETDKDGNKVIYTEGIKVQENTGWTDLLSITKVDKDTSYTVIAVMDKCICVSDDYPVPVYDIENPTIGFHGEVKYDVQMKRAYELTSDDHIRLYRAHDKNGNTVEFGNVESLYPGIVHDKPGYIVKTRSGLINIEGVVMYASDVKF